MPSLAGKARALLALAGLAVCLAGQAADRDLDGLDDELEDGLLARFAPVVILHPTEPALPGSTDWLIARSELEPEGPRPRVLAASVLGLLARPKPVEDPAARLHPRRAARAGSPTQADWVVYGHAFPGDGGGVLLQYWFFYPFNDAYGLFDHEGDWEHVTVKLGPGLAPAGRLVRPPLRLAPGGRGSTGPRSRARATIRSCSRPAERTRATRASRSRRRGTASARRRGPPPPRPRAAACGGPGRRSRARS